MNLDILLQIHSKVKGTLLSLIPLGLDEIFKQLYLVKKLITIVDTFLKKNHLCIYSFFDSFGFLGNKYFSAPAA